MPQADTTLQPLTLYSEGTRVSAEIHLPAARPESPAPAILLVHGWGGLRTHLVYHATAFARAGFVALTFDYRGWGDSDGRIVAARDAPALTEAGETTLSVRVLREIVDPIDQTTDIYNCLAVLAAHPAVDGSRIGIWGSSFGGGLAVYTAASDDRIRAAVAQVGSFALAPEFRELAPARALEKARGDIDPPVPQGIDAVPGLGGTPDLARMARFSALGAAAGVRVPTLIIDAEREELFDRFANGHAAYTIIREHAVAEYRTLPCDHYGIYYDRFYEQSVAMAIDWFGRYL